MMQMNPKNAKSISPHRAALRALMLRQPDTAQHYVQCFSLSLAEVLTTDVFVPEETITALWRTVEDFSSHHPLLPADAARLFQLSDLGERGWLVSSARDLAVALEVVVKFFADELFFIDDKGKFVTCRMSPPEKLGRAFPIYLSSVCLHVLLGQGIQPKSLFKIILPELCKPADESAVRVLTERFCSDFRAELFFSSSTFELSIEKGLLSIPFRSADPAVFQFFSQRVSHEKINPKNADPLSDKTNFKDKVKELILRNLSSNHFGCREIAAKLGVSTRTLERSLAQENCRLRELKHDLQKETAQEMLKMGVRVKEVAAKTGFADVAAFSRAFHKWTGIKPSEFREKKTDDK
jgi:AraC-like DNA-binding protein